MQMVGHTFDKPPENNAKEKSALWLINWNFKEALPVLAYFESEKFAYLYWMKNIYVTMVREAKTKMFYVLL